MLIFKQATTLQHFLKHIHRNPSATGFIPTMGALHEGHMSLIKAAQQKQYYTVCSIFVNPTQFNNREDFEKYPISVENDIEQLLAAGCDVLFLPSVDEVYPPHWQKEHYDLGSLEQVLEGAHRPGHFQGVCQVVDRLLTIVQPDAMFLGEKDFQQCMVLHGLLQLKPQHPTRLEMVPTKREADGLAMSSRNRRLDEAQRQQATAIHRALQHIKKNYNSKNAVRLQTEATQLLQASGFRVDYVFIADAGTLQPASSDTKEAVALIAASLGGVRLIDNMRL